MKKKYKLVITDRDGETHEYNEVASNPWKVLQDIYREMMLDKDWFGHRPNETIEINITEII